MRQKLKRKEWESRMGYRRQQWDLRGAGTKTELGFRELAAGKGFEVSKRGWPDFILTFEGKIFAFVEVKTHTETKLKKEQQFIAEALAQAGFPVFRWDPKTGFTRIGRKRHQCPWI